MWTQLTSKERGIIYRTRNTDPRGLRKDSKHWRLVAGTRSHCCLHTALPTVQAGRAHHCKTAGAAKSYCWNSVWSTRWDSPPVLTCAMAETIGKADGKTPRGACSKRLEGKHLGIDSLWVLEGEFTATKDLKRVLWKKLKSPSPLNSGSFQMGNWN